MGARKAKVAGTGRVPSGLPEIRVRPRDRDNRRVSTRQSAPEAHVVLELDIGANRDVVPVFRALVVVTPAAPSRGAEVHPGVAHRIRHPVLDLVRDRIRRPLSAHVDALGALLRAQPGTGSLSLHDGQLPT
jgi:hypothetical protein